MHLVSCSWSSRLASFQLAADVCLFGAHASSVCVYSGSFLVYSFGLITGFRFLSCKKLPNGFFLISQVVVTSTGVTSSLIAHLGVIGDLVILQVTGWGCSPLPITPREEGVLCINSAWWVFKIHVYMIGTHTCKASLFFVKKLIVYTWVSI